MEGEPLHELEPLAAHAAWVRRLAGRLAADAHGADDLAQETWLAALRREGAPARSPRAFLAGVLRNRARQGWRADERRRGREARALPPGAAPSAAEALQRAELGRELARLALELEEPFRSVVLLRHFEELSPRAIAACLGVPRKTVESRLARGCERLRERWRRLHPEDPAEWLSALALLAELPPPAAPGAPHAGAASAPAWGAALVNLKLVLAVAAVVVGGGGLLWPGRSLPVEPLAPVAGPAPAELAPVEPHAGSTPELARSAGPGRGREAAPRPAEILNPAQIAEAADVPARTLRGRVLDPDARPLVGIAVGFAPEAPGELVRATSGLGGRFELEAPRVAGRVAATDPALETLYAARPRASSGDELLVVVAPHRALAGVVRDELGAPVAGARVALELPPDFRARFDAVLDAAEAAEWVAASDAEGRFELERAPLVDGAPLVARLEGYEPAVADAPPVASAGLELVLRRPAVGEDTLAGRVVDEEGRPVAGALVSLGALVAASGPDGGFRLERAGAEEAHELVAVRAGHLPGRHRAATDPLTGAPRWPDWIELALGGATLELAGVVVDAEGQPRAGVEVWIDDPSSFGVLEEDLHAHLEFLAAPEGSSYAEGSDAYFRSVMTDASGRFRLHGLDARGYRLGAMDHATLQRVAAGPFPAGIETARVELPRAELAELRGRLVSRRGRPVPGAEVVLYAPTFGGVHASGGRMTTDAEGRFAFAGVAARELKLWIQGGEVLPAMRPALLVPGEELELEVELLCHFKVELTTRETEPADALRVLDAEGAPLQVHEIAAGGVTMRDRAELTAGRSETLGVSDAAASLVLLRRGEEVSRLPLQLQPGRLELVRP